MDSILAAIITGGLALVGVVITNMAGSKKTEASIARSQAVTETKLEALTEEVRRHNGFAQRLPAMEQSISDLTRRVERLEDRT